jgi:membrane-bound metal-dependent hydrolase YbcI (DUF457 family)
MNREEHVVIGIVFFAVYTYFIFSLIKLSTNTIVFGAIAVVLGSIIPDVLEPATNWMHRGLGHSKRALKFTAELFGITALIGLITVIIPIFFISYVISSFFLGYVAHLLADSTTPVGLPD